jgi:pectin methylesterase-like acyl-CoA thioesterase
MIMLTITTIKGPLAFLGLFLVALFVATLPSVADAQSTSTPTTLTLLVPTDYATIQEAVDAAASANVETIIEIAEGTYTDVR